MMWQAHLKMALASLRSAKWRSFLTMLGIIIGVVSVVTMVSLGEGVKQQLTGQINHLGKDLITIRPGKLVSRDARGTITGVNLFSSLGSSNLTENDVNTIHQLTSVKQVVPFSFITSGAQNSDRGFDGALIIATSADMPEAMSQRVQYGAFFSKGDSSRQVVVIGKRVAEQLFRQNVPIGQNLKIRGQDFVVQGIFDDFESNPLLPGVDFNAGVFMPLETAKALNNGSVQIFQILVRPSDPKQVAVTTKALQQSLQAAHGGQNDFTILTQAETLTATTRVLNTITELIAGLAAVSLIVGGIGVMNIMLVSVSDRVQEIGVRKAIGATNRQILGQFVVEAAVLSLVGGLVGVLLSIFVNFGLRIFTNLKPVISLPVVALAVAVSLVVGLIFGITPALRAARKDPIEALRRS